MKLKFVQQQVLTSLGLIGLLSSILLSIVTDSYLILFLSFLYSQLFVCLVGEQIILHRYFSHKSFKVNSLIHIVLSIISILPGQSSPISWAAAHRHHHKHSDKEFDNHSPRESYLLAAGGWILKGYHWIVNIKKLRTIPVDLIRDSKLLFLDKHYYNIWWALILILSLIDFKFTLYFLIAPIGWTLLLTAFVTLGCHIKLPGSYRNFELDDNTHNNRYIQFIILGDGLHNNHHKFPNNFNSKIKDYEFDLAEKIIKLIKIE